jgi:hypothetical protein
LGSKAFDRSVAAEDSGVVARLKQAGAILIGKANLNPLAYGAIAKEGDYDYGHMHNPWDPACVSGLQRYLARPPPPGSALSPSAATRGARCASPARCAASWA